MLIPGIFALAVIQSPVEWQVHVVVIEGSKSILERDVTVGAGEENLKVAGGDLRSCNVRRVELTSNENREFRAVECAIEGKSGPIVLLASTSCQTDEDDFNSGSSLINTSNHAIALRLACESIRVSAPTPKKGNL